MPKPKHATHGWNDRIPQMFYLRRMTITCWVKQKRVTKVVHVYWNYRNTVNGVIDTDSRDKAKTHIWIYVDAEADFYR